MPQMKFRSNRCASCGCKLVPIAKGEPPQGKKFRRAFSVITASGEQKTGYLCMGERGQADPMCQGLFEDHLTEQGARLGVKSSVSATVTPGDIYREEASRSRRQTVAWA